MRFCHGCASLTQAAFSKTDQMEKSLGFKPGLDSSHISLLQKLFWPEGFSCRTEGVCRCSAPHYDEVPRHTPRSLTQSLARSHDMSHDIAVVTH